jgi:hypothetical protein
VLVLPALGGPIGVLLFGNLLRRPDALNASGRARLGCWCRRLCWRGPFDVPGFGIVGEPSALRPRARQGATDFESW